jgi:hypothetical protein
MLPTGSFTSSLWRFIDDKPLFDVKNMERYEPDAGLTAEEAEAALRERAFQTIQNLSVPSFSQRLSINAMSWAKQPLYLLSPLYCNLGAAVNTIRFISLRIKIWNFEWSGKEVPDELRWRMISLFWMAIEDLALAIPLNVFIFTAAGTVAATLSFGALIGVFCIHSFVFSADPEAQAQSFLQRLGVASLSLGEKKEIYHLSQLRGLDLNKQTLGSFLEISTSDGLEKFRGKLHILNTIKTFKNESLLTPYHAVKDDDLWKVIQSFEDVEWNKLQASERKTLLKYKLLAMTIYVQRKLGIDHVEVSSFNSRIYRSAQGYRDASL